MPSVTRATSPSNDTTADSLPTEAVPAGRRATNKARTRASIERAGWSLLEARGFDGVTVEEIADAADVSTRTFFRYFESKEAVIFGDWRGDLRRWFSSVTDRPVEEPAGHALARGTKAFFTQCAHEAPEAARRYTIEGASRPIARFHAAVVQPEWIDGLAEAVAMRLGVEPSDHVAPRTLAAAAVGAVNSATDVWLARGASESLADLVADALDLVFDQPRPPTPPSVEAKPRSRA